MHHFPFTVQTLVKKTFFGNHFCSFLSCGKLGSLINACLGSILLRFFTLCWLFICVIKFGLFLVDNPWANIFFQGIYLFNLVGIVCVCALVCTCMCLICVVCIRLYVVCVYGLVLMFMYMCGCEYSLTQGQFHVSSGSVYLDFPYWVSNRLWTHLSRIVWLGDQQHPGIDVMFS